MAVALIDFFRHLFHRRRGHRTAEKMDRAYVSEFTNFIDHFLVAHPEVVKDQWVGREIFWDRPVDFTDLKQAARDSVPEDGYGFYYSAWGRKEGKAKNANNAPADSADQRSSASGVAARADVAPP